MLLFVFLPSFAHSEQMRQLVQSLAKHLLSLTPQGQAESKKEYKSCDARVVCFPFARGRPSFGPVRGEQQPTAHMMYILDCDTLHEWLFSLCPGPAISLAFGPVRGEQQPAAHRTHDVYIWDCDTCARYDRPVSAP